MKYLVIHNCSQCPKCAKPTHAFYKLECTASNIESGCWLGKTLEHYPFIPEWCSLPDIEQMINALINEIKSDDRYPKFPLGEANVFSNAPLALIQMGMKGKVDAYESILSLLKQSKEETK